MKSKVLVYFIFLSCIFTNHVLAKKQYGLEGVLNQCINKRSFANVKCDVLYSEQYTLGNFDTGVNFILYHLGYPALELIAKGEEAILELVSDTPTSNKAHFEKTRKMRLSLINSLEKKSKKETLNSCQKACLVKCATSNFLEYKHSGLKSIYKEDIYNSKKGVCTEFSTIASDLGESLGIEVRTVSSIVNRHAYNEVLIDNEWFMLEPQSEKCEFYQKDKPDSLGQSETKQMAISNRSKQMNYDKIYNSVKQKSFSESVRDL